MTADQYNKWTQPLRDDPRMAELLVSANKVETYLFYVLYPLLLVLLFFFDQSFLLRAIVVPGIAFVAVSVVRQLLNFNRPYEDLDIDPIIQKDTKGKSFPSRHVFSVFMIAMTWLHFATVVGVIMLVLGVTMMAFRVLGGVHYPRDVVVGALCGIVAGLVGFYFIP